MRMGLAIAIGLTLAAPAGAQDAAALAAARDCAAGGGAGCVGAWAEACQAAPGGDTTLGIAGCLTAEAEAWDALLNETWAALVAAAQARDAAEPAAAGEGQEALLRAAQRAWIAFRDADCAQEYAVWGGGSMRQIAGADCRMRRTATRALELMAKRAAAGDG